jgi:hypothetical protein
MGCIGTIPCAICKPRKTIVAKLIEHKLPQLLGVSKWGQMFDLACLKKLDNNDQMYLEKA